MRRLLGRRRFGEIACTYWLLSSSGGMLGLADSHGNGSGLALVILFNITANRFSHGDIREHGRFAVFDNLGGGTDGNRGIADGKGHGRCVHRSNVAMVRLAVLLFGSRSCCRRGVGGVFSTAEGGCGGQGGGNEG